MSCRVPITHPPMLVFPTFGPWPVSRAGGRPTGFSLSGGPSQRRAPLAAVSAARTRSHAARLEGGGLL